METNELWFIYENAQNGFASYVDTSIWVALFLLGQCYKYGFLWLLNVVWRSFSSNNPLVYTMMTSSNGIIFRVTGPMCGWFTGHRRISLTKASDPELWCFLWSAPWINGWVNNREAGDLRRHCGYYDVIAMPKDRENYHHVNLWVWKPGSTSNIGGHRQTK